jgi:hypothetical protein
MSDRHDTKMRELTYRLIQMAPEAPPFPEETMVQLRPSPSSQSTPPRRRSPLLLVGFAAAAVLLIVGIPLLVSRLSTEPAPPVTTPVPTTTPDTTIVTPPNGEPAPVTLYFVGDPVSPEDPAPVLVPVHRLVVPLVADGIPVDEATNGDYLRAAIHALVAGPTADEIALYPSLASEIPPDTEVLGVTLGEAGAGDASADTRLTIDLSSTFEAGGGSATMFARLTQVVFTATQFPEATEVVFEIDGEPVEVFSGEGIVLDGPVVRADYLDQGIVGQVFVDAPAVGATVGSPFTITGIADVFEATVAYEVTADGTVIADGFATATCGTGCWGDYSIDIDYTLDADTEGLVTVFTHSAEDGRRIDIVSHPVTMLASSGGATTQPPGQEGPVDDSRAATEAEAAIMQALVDFSRAAGAFDSVPLAPEVSLGLGIDIVETIPRADLANPSRWVLGADGFRARAGTVSLIDLLASEDIRRTVTGEHPRCAAEPTGTPGGLDGYLRISTQPLDAVSCIDWYSIDLFVDADGQIVAVTLDLYEP